MMENMSLTAAEEMQVNAIAGSFIATLFRGGAMALKGSGLGIKTTTTYTAKGLEFLADGIRNGGDTIGEFLMIQGDKLDNKSQEIDAAAEQCSKLAERMQAIRTPQAVF